MSPLRLLPLVLVLPSCGTILNGAPYMVDVQSSPAGASVFYKDRLIGQTPCAVAMDAWSMELRLSAPGCAETTHEVPNHLNWIGAIGNGLLLLPGIIVGNIVDASTGSFAVPDESSVFVNLRRGGIPALAPQSSVQGPKRLSERESEFAAYASRVGSASISDTDRYKVEGSVRIMRTRIAPLTEAREKLEAALPMIGSNSWLSEAQRLLTWMKGVEEAALKMLPQIDSGDLQAACTTAQEVDRLAAERPYAGQ
jgi:hypothetical protein